MIWLYSSFDYILASLNVDNIKSLGLALTICHLLVTIHLLVFEQHRIRISNNHLLISTWLKTRILLFDRIPRV